MLTGKLTVRLLHRSSDALALAWVFGVTLSFALWVGGTSWAHDPIHNLVAKKSAELDGCKGSPEELAELYRQRADLYRQLPQWDQCMKDLLSARALAPDDLRIEFSLATLFWDMGWSASAQPCVNNYLRGSPQDSQAHQLLAEVLFEQEQFLAAAAEFDRALALQRRQLGRGEPDLYLRRAEALNAAGSAYLQEAIEGLDAGAEELNGALSLRLYALDLEIQGEQWQAALQRVDAARAETKRPERWWVRRGDILRRCQRWEEARQAYQEALLALDRLSGLRRRVPAMLELRQQAELGLTLVLSSVGDSKPKE